MGRGLGENLNRLSLRRVQLVIFRVIVFRLVLKVRLFGPGPQSNSFRTTPTKFTISAQGTASYFPEVGATGIKSMLLNR